VDRVGATTTGTLGAILWLLRGAQQATGKWHQHLNVLVLKDVFCK